MVAGVRTCRPLPHRGREWAVETAAALRDERKVGQLESEARGAETSPYSQPSPRWASWPPAGGSVVVLQELPSNALRGAAGIRRTSAVRDLGIRTTIDRSWGDLVAQPDELLFGVAVKDPAVVSTRTTLRSLSSFSAAVTDGRRARTRGARFSCVSRTGTTTRAARPRRELVTPRRWVHGDRRAVCHANG